MGTDVTFMYVSLPLRVLGVVSTDVSLVRLEALLEASKLTIYWGQAEGWHRS